jgi:hypothetical protein
VINDFLDYREKRRNFASLGFGVSFSLRKSRFFSHMDTGALDSNNHSF